MDVSLGVQLSAADARIVLTNATPPHPVIDQSRVELTDGDILVSTLVSTDRMLTETGHRLVATRVCGDDAEQVGRVVDALRDADLTNVTVVSSPAATAAAPVLTGGETAAILSVEGDTAALSIVDAATDTNSLIAVATIDGDDRAAAYRELLDRLAEEPGGATSVVMLDPADAALNAELTAASPVPVRCPEEAEFALARGAAIAGATDAFEVPPSGADVPEPQLAYSEVADDTGGWPSVDAVPMQTPLEPLSAIDPDEVDDTDHAATSGPARPRVLLVGSTIAGIVVVGFAALAVTVAIGIRPTVSQQALRVQDPSVPGDYLPVTPGQGVKPDDKNWTVVEQIPPAGTQTVARSFVPQSLTQPASAKTPVIDMYKDGTVGVRDPNVPLPPVAPAVPAAAGQAMDPFTQLLATRLIPDFSKFTPTDVLNFVGNMTMPLVTATATAGTVALANILTSAGQSLADVGVLATVPATQGALYSTPATVPGSATGSGQAALVTSIPSGLFEPGATAEQKAAELPTGATVISELPVPKSASATSLLGAAITDPNALGPTVVGTAPLPTAESTGKEKTPGGPDVSGLPPSVDKDGKVTVPKPDAGTSDKPESGLPPEPAAVPGESKSSAGDESKSSSDEKSKSEDKSSSEDKSKSEDKSSSDEKSKSEDKSSSDEKSKSEDKSKSSSADDSKSPAVVKAPEPEVKAPAPKAPAPKVVEPAPAPAPKAPAPKVVEPAPVPAPKAPAPKVVEPAPVPAPKAPAPALAPKPAEPAPAPKPVLPSPPAAAVPKSPSSGGSSGGGLFGGGSSGGGLFGGGNG